MRSLPTDTSLDATLSCKPEVATVVTTGADSLRVKAVFRTNLDLAGLIWQVEDKTDHGLFRGRDTAPFIAQSGIVPDWIIPTI